MPDKVLLATRLRPEPDPVAQAAARLARGLSAELVLLYVADELGTVGQVHAATGLDPEQLRERMISDIRAAADEFVRRNLSGATVRTVIEEGDVVERIVAAASAEAADYLVIGTEGRSAIQELILGSTANGILRRAPCPVVVVPARAGSEGAPCQPEERSGEGVVRCRAEAKQRLQRSARATTDWIPACAGDDAALADAP